MIKNDCIKITNLQIFAHHGVFEEEKENGQDFYLDVVLYLDLHSAGKSDDLTKSLHYGDCAHFIHKIFTEKSFDLIEAACEYVCEGLLLEYNLLDAVEVELKKPHAPIGLPFENVSVTMFRKWHKAYISFGSNMGDKERYIQEALDQIKKNEKIKNVRISSCIETAAYGPVEQESFLNGCVAFDTLMNQEELLEYLHLLEGEAGRTRELRWGPRTLDLDIVFFDQLVYESSDLIIPHLDVQNREFVLAPLLELCPNYRHPILKKTVRQMLQEIRKEEFINR